MPTRTDIIASLVSPDGEFALEDIEREGVPQRVYKKAPAAMRGFLLMTRAYGEKPFLIYEDEVLTFGEHLRQVAALAAYLKAAGVAKGDRVAIGLRHYPEWVTAFWACQALGAVAVALNAWWTGTELEYGLTDWLRLQTNLLQATAAQQLLFQTLQDSGFDLIFFFTF